MATRARSFHETTRRRRARQRGAIMILFVVGMVAIIGIAGLALDGGHMMLSKSRLQNTVDAAALSAAKVLDDTGDKFLATTAANNTFADNANAPGNGELSDAWSSGSINVTVEYSSTLNPFVPGSEPAAYVRVRAQDLSLAVWFSRVLGFTDKRVAASAVAGPSPTLGQACNVMPMMVCGDPNENPAEGAPTFWGYTLGQPEVLKTTTTGGDFEVGPGNFQLIRLEDADGNVLSGGADIRRAMAGEEDLCLPPSGEPIETEPGNTVGPVVQGLNTRFGNYTGPMAGRESDYPPDVIVEQPGTWGTPLTYDNETDQIMSGSEVVTSDAQVSFGYEEYMTRYRSGVSNFDNRPLDADPPGPGQRWRRETAIAIGDCSGVTNGQGQVPLLGVGCFFLVQEASQKGNESYVFGQFIERCQAGGVTGDEPTDVPGPYLIQLYRDYSSTDS